MHYLLSAPVIGERGGLWSLLLRAAENHEPIAYFAACTCAFFIIGALFYYAIECKRLRGEASSGSVAQATVQLLGTIVAPAIIFLWLLSKMVT